MASLMRDGSRGDAISGSQVILWTGEGSVVSFAAASGPDETGFGALVERRRDRVRNNITLPPP
ncbi:MAG TPA: hypothetical protein VHU15_07105 [Stellaceae bacterium]|jgi:hypothetical protein|nr:hypothetical protein [Stellaceae bacterium]